MNSTGKQTGETFRKASPYLLFVFVLSFFTYFYGYWQPAAVFWDEPYHIAAAQKYISGVYFMEQHPPLGKLLIAAGEKMFHGFHPKQPTDQFINTDYARGFENGYSFVGYRFFPSLLGWLTAPLLFLIFFLITRSGVISALTSFLYVFDNALIVHSRGAMVDTPLTFFEVAMILLFLLLLDEKHSKSMKHLVLLSALFGASFAAVMTTKLVGLIMILLVPALVWKFWGDSKKIGTFLAVTLTGFLVVFVGVWQTHFALGKKIVPELSNNGYYQASDEYKAILTKKASGNIGNFGVMIKDSFAYVPFYSKGVPRLDLCKTDENGSPFFMWPFGARSINYRWEQVNDTTFKYLYLQANPVVWFLGLLAIIFSAAMLLGSVFFTPKEPIKHPWLMFVVLGMYLSYMAAISTLDRVMYLYHYFTPLIFSFILFALVMENINQVGKWKIKEDAKIGILTVIGIFIFIGFQLYRPLSYYEPISNKGIERLSIVPLWELTCAKCQRESILAVPFRNP